MSTITATTAAAATEQPAPMAVNDITGQTPGAQASLTTGGYQFPGIPKIDDPYKKRQWQLEHMAGAIRVFARKGFTEGTSGHISVRDPVDPPTFWSNPSLANEPDARMGKHFVMLNASDMGQVDENGQVIGGNDTAINAAGFMIHSAIHRARPDIHAACHTHSPAGKAWPTFGRPLDIINQGTCNFHNAQAGVRIAEALGETGRVIVLQNHGLLTTAGTVDEAAYLFNLMERYCAVQIMRRNLTAKVNADPESNSVEEYETLYTEFQPDLIPRKSSAL
ncbi:hypothetical protein BDW75DRAFT_234001 [Aspergillus navahoensis]